jgi:hypothetical protein
VRRRDGDAAVEAEVPDSEVDHLGSDEAEVEDFRTRFCGAPDRRGRHRWRGEAHVPADRDPARLEVLDVRPANRVGAFLVNVRGIDAAYVVGFENLRVEHSGMLSRSRVSFRSSFRISGRPNGGGKR